MAGDGVLCLGVLGGLLDGEGPVDLLSTSTS